jgi:hypothetical protein
MQVKRLAYRGGEGGARARLIPAFHGVEFVVETAPAPPHQVLVGG